MKPYYDPRYDCWITQPRNHITIKAHFGADGGRGTPIHKAEKIEGPCRPATSKHMNGENTCKAH